MKKFTYKVELENGLHARPAGKITTACKQFESDINLYIDENRGADGKRLLSIMALGARCGDEIAIEIEGSDEEEAAKALQTVLNNLGNEE